MRLAGVPLLLLLGTCTARAGEAVDPLTGQWQLTWTGAPQPVQGQLILFEGPAGWTARLRLDGSKAVLEQRSFQRGSPSRVAFSLREDQQLVLELQVEGDRLVGTATVPGQVEASALEGTRGHSPEAVPGPYAVPMAEQPAAEAAAGPRSMLEVPTLVPSVPLLSGDGATAWRWEPGPDGPQLLAVPSDSPPVETAGGGARWAAVEPRGDSALLLQPGNPALLRVDREGERVELARLPSARLRWVEPLWERDLLVVALHGQPAGTRVVQVDLSTGQVTPLAQHPTAEDVVLGADLAPRIWLHRELQDWGLGVRRWITRVTGADGADWGQVAQPTWVEDRQPVPRVGDGPIHLLAGPDLVGLTTIDPDGPKLEPLPGAWGDATHLLVGPEGTVDAVGWTAERLHWVPLTDDGQELAWLSEQLDGDVAIVSRAPGDRHWVVATWSGSDWPHHLHFDRDARTLTPLTTVEAPGGPLPQRDPLVLTARDGRQLAAYLTRPDASRFGPGPWPLVLDIHGGPWSGRHTWTVDPFAVGWADRGYAVLQVDFRGTHGFGWQLTHSAEARFGRTMMDDLLDGLAWTVQEGVADPDRVAAVGSSYGGYAALRLATLPDPVVACASAGLVRGNLTVPGGGLHVRGTGSLRWRKRHSPDRFTQHLSEPVLVWNGGLDGEHADSIQEFVHRAEGHDKDVVWLRFPWEAHGLVSMVNSRAMMAIQDHFLSACLGGPAGPWPDDFHRAEVEVRGDPGLVPGLVERVEEPG